MSVIWLVNRECHFGLLVGSGLGLGVPERPTGPPPNDRPIAYFAHRLRPFGWGPTYDAPSDAGSQSQSDLLGVATAIQSSDRGSPK